LKGQREHPFTIIKEKIRKNFENVLNLFISSGHIIAVLTGTAIPGGAAAGNVKLSGAPKSLPVRPPKFSASTQASGWRFPLW